MLTSAGHPGGIATPACHDQRLIVAVMVGVTRAAAVHAKRAGSPPGHVAGSRVAGHHRDRFPDANGLGHSHRGGATVDRHCDRVVASIGVGVRSRKVGSGTAIPETPLERPPGGIAPHGHKLNHSRSLPVIARGRCGGDFPCAAGNDEAVGHGGGEIGIGEPHVNRPQGACRGHIQGRTGAERRASMIGMPLKPLAGQTQARGIVRLGCQHNPIAIQRFSDGGEDAGIENRALRNRRYHEHLILGAVVNCGPGQVEPVVEGRLRPSRARRQAGHHSQRGLGGGLR